MEKEADDDEIEEFIKTVEDDVLENKYSSSFEGNITSPQPEEEHVMSEQLIASLNGSQFRQSTDRATQCEQVNALSKSRPVTSIPVRSSLQSARSVIMIEETFEHDNSTGGFKSSTVEMLSPGGANNRKSTSGVTGGVELQPRKLVMEVDIEVPDPNRNSDLLSVV